MTIHDFKKDERVVFVHLGRYGDLMLMFPAFKHIFETTGIKPVCVVSKQFVDLFDGISYAEPDALEVDFLKGCQYARKYAEEKYGKVIIPKWWDYPVLKDNPPKRPEKLGVQMTPKLKMLIPDEKDWENYHVSSWEYAGFTRQQLVDWPLVFDRRNLEREHRLYHVIVGRNQKPLLLVNLHGYSSPFAPVPEVLRVVYATCGNKFHVIDLSRIVADRIFDLLGVFNRSAGMVTTDTATLHLAAASAMPYICFTNMGGFSSFPKGNCILRIKYSETLNRLGELKEALEML